MTCQIAAVLVKRVQICIGMAAPGYQEGDLFCLEPTSNNAGVGWGGRYKYQQVVIGYIIEEFGLGHCANPINSKLNQAIMWLWGEKLNT